MGYDLRSQIMKTYIKDHFEFDLLDMLKYLIGKWFIILIAGCVCAALIGGYKYIKNSKPANEDTENDATLDYDRMLDSYYSSQADLDSATQGIYDSISNQNEYFNNSILYRIDYNSAPTTMLGYDLIITSNNYENRSEAVYNYYLYNLSNGDYLNDLSNELVIEPQYLNELIVVEEKSGELIQPIEGSTYCVDCSLTITVNGLDENMCGDIADRIEDEIVMLYQNDPFSSQYTLNQTFRTYAYVHSNRVMNAQQTANNYYDNLFGKLKNYTSYKSGISVPENSNGTTNSPNSVYKYAVLAFVLGVVLSSVVLMVIYMFDTRVSDSVRFRCRYDLSDLGSSPAMIATNIKLSLNTESALVFSGTADQIAIKTLIDSIKSDLDGYNLIEASDILNNPDQRIKLRQADNVVLVEKKKKSQYSAIDEELKVLAGMNKNVVGVILI